MNINTIHNQVYDGVKAIIGWYRMLIEICIDSDMSIFEQAKFIIPATREIRKYMKILHQLEKI